MPQLHKYVNGSLLPQVEAQLETVALEAFLAGDTTGAVRLAIPSDADVRPLAGRLDDVAAITLEFPAFKDGRAYTQARLLRERLGFRGEIRATGDVLRDQILFMVRCGVDAFELADDADVDGFAEALEEFSVFYQSAADDATPIARLRATRAAA